MFYSARVYIVVGWIIHPAMRGSRDTAVIAVFTAMVIASDFALVPYVNVKLMDVTVFLVAYVFGFRQGAAVALLSETIWSVISPWGFAGIIAPFLVVGELLFAGAGWGAYRVWGRDGKILSPTAIFIGATLAICAFVWDLETNAATALIATWPGTSWGQVAVYELQGFVFPTPLAHELWDLVLGVLLAPAAIVAMPRVRRV
jgi:hypothetical protein